MTQFRISFDDLHSVIRAGALALIIALLGGWSPRSAAKQSNDAVTIVSAARYDTVVAPGSIASAFGTRLATQAAVASGLPLPTTLAGTTVSINGAPAGLFFVSSTQINLLVPSDSAPGVAEVVVTAGDGTVSRGTVRVEATAPALFTINGNGRGLPAGYVMRVSANGDQQPPESLADFNPATGTSTAHPIKFGPSGEMLFLVLFLTGVRGAADPDHDGNFNETVHVLLGGRELTPTYVGAQPNFAGLDQLNVEIPRALSGRGAVNLAVNYSSVTLSNLAGIEIGGEPMTEMAITNYSATTMSARDELVVRGTGFAATASGNEVYFVDEQGQNFRAQLTAATTTELRVVVPFGAGSGYLLVRTAQAEARGAARLRIRASVSGVVEDTGRQPLRNVLVRLQVASGQNFELRTDVEGVFLFKEMSVLDNPAGLLATLRIDATGLPSQLPYPALPPIKLRVQPERDNRLAAPVAIQQVSGPSLTVGQPSLRAGAPTGPLALRQAKQTVAPHDPGVRRLEAASPEQVTIGQVKFDVPNDTQVTFPDGTTRGSVALTVVANSRTPISLPPREFSSSIVQLTPFGARFTKGGKLTFPNPERLPAGAQAKLYAFATDGPGGVSSFVQVGLASVSADGQRIETAAGAIMDTNYYFVSLPRQVTTVVGRVVDSDGTAVRGARVRSRGQDTFTDGSGGFVLENVLVNPGDTLTVEAGFPRPNGRIDRKQSAPVPAVPGGVTLITTALVLPADGSNRVPVLLAPPTIAINESETRTTNLVSFDPDAGQAVQLSVASAPFATIVNPGGGNDVYTLRLAPQSGDGGSYTLTLTATDTLGLSLAQQIALKVNRAPRALDQVVEVEPNQPKAITLTATDADNDPLSFIIVRQPAQGRLTGAPPQLTYTPNQGAGGSDSFTFKANDSLADSNTATVTLAIRAANRPPELFVPGPQALDTDQDLQFPVMANDPDIGQTLTFSATNLPFGATFVPAGATRADFAWRPSAAQVGSHRVIFTVKDNGIPLGEASGEVIITATPRWKQSSELPGGQFFVFLSSAGQLRAGGSGGVYRSLDSGQSWMLPSQDLANTRVFALVASGVNLFAGTDGSGIFYSPDGGLHWEPVREGLPQNAVVTSLVVRGPDLFAGIRGDGVFRSSDQGLSWEPINDGLTNRDVNALVSSDAGLFAGTNNGVFKLPNGSQSWVSFSTGLPANMRTVLSLAVDGTLLYVGLDQVGVYRSPSAAPNWTAFNSSGLTNSTVLSMAVNGTDLCAGTYGGVFCTPTQSPTWAVRSRGLTNIVVTGLAVAGNLLLAGTQGGVFRSFDRGLNWLDANAGLLGVVVNSLAVNGANLFAGTSSDGVFRSIDDGKTWVRTNTGANGGLQSRTVPELAVMGANLFAGTDNGVYFSLNNGASWQECNTGLPVTRYVNALAVTGTTLYAGISNQQNGGVFVATNWSNQCRPWTRVSTGITDRDVQSLTACGDCLFAGTENGGIFRSCDLGQNWTPINTGLTSLRVKALTAVERADSGQPPKWLVFAGTGDGVFLLDGCTAQSWTRISEGLPPGPFVNTLLVNGDDLYAGLFYGLYVLPLFAVTDAEHRQSWKGANTDLTHFNVFALAARNNQLFAGTIGGGVYFNR